MKRKRSLYDATNCDQLPYSISQVSTDDFQVKVKVEDYVLSLAKHLFSVAARGEIGPEGCEISSLAEHMGLSPWLFFYNIVAFQVTPAVLILSNS